jgi:hypothetical protein
MISTRELLILENKRNCQQYYGIQFDAKSQQYTIAKSIQKHSSFAMGYRK